MIPIIFDLFVSLLYFFRFNFFSNFREHIHVKESKMPFGHLGKVENALFSYALGAFSLVTTFASSKTGQEQVMKTIFREQVKNRSWNKNILRIIWSPVGEQIAQK